MTQPEETTAALIARLHEELTIKEAQLANVRKSEAVHVDLAHKAYQERDRAKADLESSKAECLQWRKDIDIERAEVARLSRQLENTKGMLAERSGQSDGWFRACKQAEKKLGEQLARAEKAEAELAHVRLMLQERTAMGDEYYAGKQRAENMLAERTRERDEARAEALKVGLAGKEAAENCDAATAACRRAQRLAEEAGADCDRALRERDEAREQLAKLEWAGLERPATGGPLLAACVICHGFKNDRAAHRFFTSTDQIGHRPTCWFAKKEAEKSEERTIDDALIRAAASLAVSYAWRYACGADVGTQDATETARPEPRFKVGEKVVWEESQTSQREGHVESIGNGAYLVRSRSGHLFSWAEDRLKPAPKFAVGEWVEAKGVTGPVIARHWERSRANTWSYDVQTPRWVRLLYEFELTAQTPQHKHDCEGCVFLGRMGEWDLYYCKESQAPWPVYVAVQRLVINICDAALPSHGVIFEARRRAVARGLVK